MEDLSHLTGKKLEKCWSNQGLQGLVWIPWRERNCSTQVICHLAFQYSFCVDRITFCWPLWSSNLRRWYFASHKMPSLIVPTRYLVMKRYMLPLCQRGREVTWEWIEPLTIPYLERKEIEKNMVWSHMSTWQASEFFFRLSDRKWWVWDGTNPFDLDRPSKKLRLRWINCSSIAYLHDVLK